jgi:hypothetical protein
MAESFEGVAFGSLPQAVPVMDVPMYSDNQLRAAVEKARAEERKRILDLMPRHVRESATPTPDGYLIGDCSCGEWYKVPQGGDEFLALNRAHAEHVSAKLSV